MIMATATFDADLVGNIETTATEPKAGFFGRLLSTLIAAREMEARKKAATTLANVSDRSLIELGLGAREIEALRHGTSLNVELTG
jgi:hypothetical protein